MNSDVKSIIDAVFSIADDFNGISMPGAKRLGMPDKSFYSPELDLVYLILPDQLPSGVEGELHGMLIMQGEQLITNFVKNPYYPVPIISRAMKIADPVETLRRIARFNIVVRHEILLHRLTCLASADMVQWLMLVHSLANTIDVKAGHLELSPKQENFLQEQDTMFRNRLWDDIAYIVEGQAFIFDFITYRLSLSHWLEAMRGHSVEQAKEIAAACKAFRGEALSYLKDVFRMYKNKEEHKKASWYLYGADLVWPIFEVFGLEGVIAASLIALNPVETSTKLSSFEQLRKIAAVLPSKVPSHLQWKKGVEDSKPLIQEIANFILNEFRWKDPTVVFEKSIKKYSEILETNGFSSPMGLVEGTVGPIMFSYDLSGRKLLPTVTVTREGGKIRYLATPESLLQNDEFWQQMKSTDEITKAGNVVCTKLLLARKVLNHLGEGKTLQQFNLKTHIQKLFSQIESSRWCW